MIDAYLEPDYDDHDWRFCPKCCGQAIWRMKFCQFFCDDCQMALPTIEPDLEFGVNEGGYSYDC